MGAMGTGLRLFIVVEGLGGLIGWGHLYEALEECLRSPSDQNFCRVLKLEVGRLAQLTWDIYRQPITVRVW